MVLANAKGNRLNRTPKFTATADINYSRMTDIGKFGASVSYYYNDGFYWEVGNNFREPSYNLVNAELSWAPKGTSATFRIWGENITGAKYNSFMSIASNGNSYAPSAPVTHGVTLETTF